MSLFSFFEISTFDGWAPIMYINIYGCDKYPSDYVMYNASDQGGNFQLTYQRFGTMFMPICHSPRAHPFLAPIFFMSFVVMAGFILVSLTVAVVTSGINDRLEMLKDIDESSISKELQKIDRIRQDQDDESLLISRDAAILSLSYEEEEGVCDTSIMSGDGSGNVGNTGERRRSLHEVQTASTRKAAEYEVTVTVTQYILFSLFFSCTRRLTLILSSCFFLSIGFLVRK